MYQLLAVTLLNHQVTATLDGTRASERIKQIYQEHLAAAVQCSSAGYTVRQMVEPAPEFVSSSISETESMEARIIKATEVKLNG